MIVYLPPIREVQPLLGAVLDLRLILLNLSTPLLGLDSAAKCESQRLRIQSENFPSFLLKAIRRPGSERNNW